MEKEIVVGDSVLIMKAIGKNNTETCKLVSKIIPKIEQRLIKIIEKYGLPEEILINFKTGDETLDGIYHSESKEVSKNITFIDIFTKQLSWMKKEKSEEEVSLNLIDTLIHELVHNKIQNETKTKKIVFVYMKKNRKKIINELKR